MKKPTELLIVKNEVTELELQDLREAWNKAKHKVIIPKIKPMRATTELIKESKETIVLDYMMYESAVKGVLYQLEQDMIELQEMIAALDDDRKVNPMAYIVGVQQKIKKLLAE